MVVSLVNCDDVCPGATGGAHVRTDRECVGWAYGLYTVQYEVCVCVVHVCVASMLVSSRPLFFYLNTIQ